MYTRFLRKRYKMRDVSDALLTAFRNDILFDDGNGAAIAVSEVVIWVVSRLVSETVFVQGRIPSALHRTECPLSNVHGSPTNSDVKLPQGYR